MAASAGASCPVGRGLVAWRHMVCHCTAQTAPRCTTSAAHFVQRPPLVVVHAPGVGKATHSMRDSGRDGRQPTVLIASHQEASSRMFESILVPGGYGVVKAYTAAQTRERARHTLRGLPRRAQDLASRASRQTKAFACVMSAPDSGAPGSTAEPADEAIEAAVEQLAGAFRTAGRQSDAIGRVGPTEFAVVAFGTDAAGSVKLAERLAQAVYSGASGGGGDATATFRLRAGYYAVADPRLQAADAAATVLRAAAAMRQPRTNHADSWIQPFPDDPGGAPGAPSG